MTPVIAEDRVKRSQWLHYVAQYKISGTRQLIDLRKFTKYINVDSFCPSTKYDFCVEVDQWKKIIPMLYKLVKLSDKSYRIEDYL